jgi:HEAT repeat protein
MQDEARLAILMGRVIGLLRSSSEGMEDHKAALQAVSELTARGSMTVRVEGGELSVEGVPIPSDTPFAGELARQLAAHDIAALAISHGTLAVDMLQVLREIALDPSNYPVGSDAEQRIREAGIASVFLITAQADKATKERADRRISDAVRRSRTMSAEDARRPPDMTVVPSVDGAAYDEMVRHIRASASTTLAGSVGKLRKEDPGPSLMMRLEAVQHAIANAMREDNVPQGLEAILVLIKEEEEAEHDESRRAFAITLRRVLTRDTLRRLAPFLVDEIYTEDVDKIMRRAGTEGTRILLEMLVAAPTFAERKAYLTALRGIEEGTDVIASMLNHSEWFVVRNAADLVGELGILDAIPALGRATEHDDPRVRGSVALALGKLGTPEAGRYLRTALRDNDRDVRLAAARAIEGRGLSGLAMVLLNATDGEEDPEILGEDLRALGRIGTPDAVRALVEIAQPGKGMLGRKSTDRRRAATEGLGLAGGDTAREALEQLAQDRDREVREAARQGLRSRPLP